MRISDISLKKIEIYRDASFTNVGHIFSPVKDRIVPAQNEEDLYYCINNPDIAGVVIPPDLLPYVNKDIGIVLSQTPLETAIHILNEIGYRPDCQCTTSIHPSAKIHPSADISPVQVTIGKNVRIDEYVTIKPGTQIRDNVVINALTSIGHPCGSYPLSQAVSIGVYGTVIIDEGAFIHANCSIERPLFADTTYIGCRCQIDSLTLIGAGVTLGSYSLIAGIVTIGEYATIGARSWLGPNTTIGRGVQIGDSCHITLGSKVTKNIGSQKIVKDNWAVDREKFKGIIS